jgi:hypothetical protein
MPVTFLEPWFTTWSVYVSVPPAVTVSGAVFVSDTSTDDPAVVAADVTVKPLVCGSWAEVSTDPVVVPAPVSVVPVPVPVVPVPVSVVPVLVPVLVESLIVGSELEVLTAPVDVVALEGAEESAVSRVCDSATALPKPPTPISATTSATRAQRRTRRRRRSDSELVFRLTLN